MMRAQPEAASAAPQTPESRSTEFVSVEGGTETSSAETLLVTAYALMWLATLVFVFLTWRKQNLIAARLTELEQKLRSAPRG